MPDDIGEQLRLLRHELASELAMQRENYFGSLKPSWVKYAEDYFWDAGQQDFRIDDLRQSGFLPGESKVLDLAGGCGQFLERASEEGYDCIAVEPQESRLKFIRAKLRALGKPSEWSERVVCGVGENLPFSSDTFDCVTSFQTLEHVQDPPEMIKEMVRVAKPGGGVLLRCPDYRSTFEAHYRLPWLPLFARPLAKRYLSLLGRPTAGLDTIQYVTRPRILRWLRALQEEGCSFTITDRNKLSFVNALRRRGLPRVPGSYLLWRLLQYLKGLFRREISVSLFIRIQAKRELATMQAPAAADGSGRVLHPETALSVAPRH